MTRLKPRARRGFTLIEVAMATVILIAGSLFVSVYFKNVFDQLSPQGGYGGIRRYMMAEEMLRAQAEGLRALPDVPAGANLCKLITEPVGSGYQLSVTQYPVAPAEAAETIYYFDLVMTQNGQPVGKLSLSTLRRPPGGADEKIGL